MLIIKTKIPVAVERALMLKNYDKLRIDNLELDYFYDPRRVASYLYAGESLPDGKRYIYRLVKEEHSSVAVEAKPLIELPDGHKSIDSLKQFLQKIVDFAFENFQIVPSKYILESSTQTAHLNDMRKIVSKTLNVDL